MTCPAVTNSKIILLGAAWVAGLMAMCLPGSTAIRPLAAACTTAVRSNAGRLQVVPRHPALPLRAGGRCTRRQPRCALSWGCALMVAGNACMWAIQL